MRQYEVAYIVHPDLDETAFAEVNDRIRDLIEKGEGKVTKVDLWGKKRLAYEIRKQREGQYVFLQTEMPPALCSECRVFLVPRLSLCQPLYLLSGALA